MAKKFICTTQEQHLTTYIGPSGRSYESMRGYEFSVDLEQDIEFFSKKRQMQEVGLFKPAPIIIVKDASEKLQDLLNSLGIAKTSVKKLVDIYMEENVLLTEIEAGNDLSRDINKKDAAKVVAYLLKEELEE
jgi:hypothetical protein